MDLRKLITMLVALGVLAGAGVAGALASSPTRSADATPTTTTVCAGHDQQGDNEEADAATEIDQAADEVEQEATRQQADDQNGDDQPAEQGDDDQGENEGCDD